MGRSVVGEVVARCFLLKLPLCEEQGLGKVEVKLIGGLEVMLVMENVKTVENILQDKDRGLRRRIHKPRCGGDMVRTAGRLTWINIMGLPPSCSGKGMFKKIAALHGTILALRNCRLEGNQNLIYGRVNILTNNKGLIKEDLQVVVKGNTHDVSVVEEIRNVLTLDLQNVDIKGDDKRYGKEENDMQIDEEDGDDEEKSVSDEGNNSEEEGEGGKYGYNGCTMGENTTRNSVGDNKKLHGKYNVKGIDNINNEILNIELKKSVLNCVKGKEGSCLCVPDGGFEDGVQNVNEPNKGCVMGHNNEIENNNVDGIYIVGRSDPLSRPDCTNRHEANEEYATINDSLQGTSEGNIERKADKEEHEHETSNTTEEKKERDYKGGKIRDRKEEKRGRRSVTKAREVARRTGAGIGENNKGISDVYKEQFDAGSKRDKKFRFGHDNEGEAVNSKCNVNMEQVKEIGEMIGVSWVAAEKEKERVQGRGDIVADGTKMISVNVRGMGDSGKKGWIRSILKVDQPDVIGLQETKSGDLTDMARWMGCDIGEFLFTYLGLPIGENMRRVNAWTPVVEKFKKRLADWKAKTMSFGGRLTLVKLVLGSLP
ncbi:transposon TX1, partial [Tanacetum coccineum]